MLPKAGFVLIIDDDKTTGGLLRILLRMEGYEAIHVASCDEAATIARYRKPSLILLDYLLQDETCERLVDNGKVFGTPVILISAYSYAREAYERLHFSAFLPKPFELETLIELIKSVA